VLIIGCRLRVSQKWLQQKNYNSACPMCKARIARTSLKFPSTPLTLVLTSSVQAATTKKKLVQLHWDGGADESFTQVSSRRPHRHPVL
jgi:hypothetical protein